MNRRYLKDRLRLYLAVAPYLFCRFLLPGIHARNRGKTRVLVFHHLDEPDLFERAVRAISRRYHLISFEQYLRGQKASDRINIILAFDDGYHSWFTHGLPVFQKYNVHPLFFINSDFIGLAEEEAKRYCREAIGTWPEAGLAWKELKALAAQGEVGGHGRGHRDLSAIVDESAIMELMASDRVAIESATGAPARCFAYPFGRYSAIASASAEKAGYAYAFTSDSGFLEDSASPFLLKRTNLGMRPPPVALAVIEGWGDRISAAMRLLKRYL
ncbi:MAG: polysaccharide deacetylase family protein [Pseudomonadota bacterium]|nr:polysaccharide deacetylase family protein [Pseudomonadota bacterium]